jgi:hypothetical protein
MKTNKDKQEDIYVEIISLQSSWNKNLTEKIELFKWTINKWNNRTIYSNLNEKIEWTNKQTNTVIVHNVTFCLASSESDFAVKLSSCWCQKLLPVSLIKYGQKFEILRQTWPIILA